MLGKGEKRLVAAYSAAHFAVDLCCAMLVLPAAPAALRRPGPHQCDIYTLRRCSTRLS